jgi:hypothetical protein
MKQGAFTTEELQDGAIDGELTALSPRLRWHPLDRFDAFSKCALRHQRGLLRATGCGTWSIAFASSQACGLVADYGNVGIQNVLANTLKEAAANGETVLSNGHDKNNLDEIGIRQDATLSALPALPAFPALSDIQPDHSITGTWAEPDWTILDDRRGGLSQFPTDTFPAPWRDWLRRAARGAGATEGHVAVPLLAIASSLIGTSRRVRGHRRGPNPAPCGRQS